MQFEAYYKHRTIALVISLFSTHAMANDEAPAAFLIAGPASTPEFQGSDDYSLVPMLVSNFSLGRSQVEIEGLELRARWQGNSNMSYGLLSSVDFGRDAEVESPLIAQFSEIDTAVNLGGFIAYHYPNRIFENDSVELRTGILADVSNTHDGQLLTFTATYTFPLYIPWRVELELESSYATSQYMDTYFGVTADNAMVSGLPQYQPSASLRDLSFNANIGLFISPDWGGFLRLGVSRLLGDAKDSPIVQHGSASQYFVGLGVYHRFGGQ